MYTLRFPAALVAALVVWAPAVHAQSGAETTGVFHVVWGDPLQPAPALQLHTLTVDDGRTLQLDLDPELAAPWGGAGALHGRRITIRGEAVAPAVRVRSLRPSDRAADALRFGASPDLSAASAGVESQRWLTVLCRFSDHPEEPASVGYFQALMGDAYPGVSHFWSEGSDGRLSIDGRTVRGWYTLPGTRDDYVPSFDSPRLSQLLEDCVSAADADVHFPDFDGINIQVNDHIGCCAWGGGSWLLRDGVGKSYGVTWLPWEPSTGLGTLAHEIGHALGLPHSSGPYGFPYDSRWDIMSDAHFALLPDGRTIGTQTIADHKRRLGWIPTHRQVTAGPGETTVLLERSALPGANDNALILMVPLDGIGPRYYSVEARRRAGYDTPLPAEGVVVHLLSGRTGAAQVVDVDGNGNPNDTGSWLGVGESFMDWQAGIEIDVTERVGEAYRVTVRRPDYLTIAVDTTTRVLTIPFGADSVLHDSARITITGPGADAVSWTAQSFHSLVTLTESAGVGSGWVRWRTSTAGLPPQTYYGGVQVAIGSTFLQIARRVEVTSAGTLTLGAWQSERSDTLFVGGSQPAGHSLVLSGPGADTTAWTLSSDAAWLVPEAVEGTGSTNPSFTLDAAGLEPGSYTGTITIEAPGAEGTPLVLTQALEVLAPVTFEVHRPATSARAPQEGALVTDSIYVSVQGDHADRVRWDAWGSSMSGIYLRPRPGARHGSGWLVFGRDPAGLAPGSHENIWILQTMHSERTVLRLPDTLHIDAAPPTIVLGRSGGRDSVVVGMTPSMDSLDVTPFGADSRNMAWVSVQGSGQRFAFISRGGTFSPGGGRGPGRMWWLRNTDGREPGVHVDTFHVRFLDSGVLHPYVDTLVVLGAPRIEGEAPERRTTVLLGSSAPIPDSMALTLSGWKAADIAWTAAADAPWLTLEGDAGTGSGRLRWTRDPTGLQAGTYTDTIRVTTSRAAAGAPLHVVDVLVVRPPVFIASDSVRPGATMGAMYADRLEADGGPPADARWRLTAGTLPPGVALDSVSGSLAGIPEAGGTFRFTVRLDVEIDDERAFRLDVAHPALDPELVLDHLLDGGRSLTEDHARFLDLLGNRNGRVDVGDVRAWMETQP